QPSGPRVAQPQDDTVLVAGRPRPPVDRAGVPVDDPLARRVDRVVRGGTDRGALDGQPAVPALLAVAVEDAGAGPGDPDPVSGLVGRGDAVAHLGPAPAAALLEHAR